MTTQARDVYGNITKPGKLGLLGLSLGLSLLLVPLVVLAVLFLATGKWAIALVMVGFAGVGLAGTTIRDRSGRNVYERGMVKTSQRRKNKRGDNFYLGGPTGKTPDGKTRLPGLLAASELSSHVDTFGNPFGLIRVPAAKHYTVVIEAYPDGDALVDQDRINSQVAHWGAWLAQLGVDEGVVGASVTVETTPDSGLRLRRMMSNAMAATASPFAAAVAEAIPQQSQSTAPAITTRIAVTFSGVGLDKDGSDRGVAAMADEIGNRVPILLSTLHDTGAGTSVRAATAQEIVDFTRASYDPTVAAEIEQAQADGGTGLIWHDAGPTYHDDQIDRYFHDRAVSKSWQMFEGPRGQFYANALSGVLAPTSGVLRKRVTILYRPIPASATTEVIEADINNAQFSGSTKQRVSARAKQRISFAHKSAEEEALGAGLVRFGMVVTVSCASSKEFPRLEKAIPGLANRARLRIRETLGNQAVAFQTGLPLGLVLPAHTIVPAQAREWI